MQILHSGGNHWIAVSTIGSTPPSTVRVYDSLNTANAWYKEADCSYCPFTRRGNQARVCQCTGKQHLCQLSCKLCYSVLFFDLHKQSMIVVCFPLLVQWQYAMVNLQRVWTTTQRWWENTLLDVWKIKSSVIFQQKECKQETKRSELLKVYYTCRLPEGGERMIACDNCGEWYHESCLNSVIPSEAWTDCNYKWTCDLC